MVFIYFLLHQLGEFTLRTCLFDKVLNSSDFAGGSSFTLQFISFAVLFYTGEAGKENDH